MFSWPSSRKGSAWRARFLTRSQTGTSSFYHLVPRNQGGCRNHYHNAYYAGSHLHADALIDLDHGKMRGKGQEYAEAEDFERMLTAQYGWPQPCRVQSGPIRGHEPQGEHREG